MFDYETNYKFFSHSPLNLLWRLKYVLMSFLKLKNIKIKFLSGSFLTENGKVSRLQHDKE